MNKLKAVREKKKMTILELSVTLNVSASAVYSWENGTRTPSYKNMSKISMAVYIADMLEESRDFPGLIQLREQLGMVSLENLDFSISILESKQKEK